MVASNSIMFNKSSDKKSVLPVYHDDEIDYETKMNRFDSDSEAEEEEFGYDSGVPSMLKHGINALVGSDDVNVQGQGSVVWALFLLFLSFVIVVVGGVFCANTLVPLLQDTGIEGWVGAMMTGTAVTLEWVLKLAAVGGSILVWIVGYLYVKKYFGGSVSATSQFLAYSYGLCLLPLAGCVIATLMRSQVQMAE